MTVTSTRHNLGTGRTWQRSGHISGSGSDLQFNVLPDFLRAEAEQSSLSSAASPCPLLFFSLLPLAYRQLDLHHFLYRGILHIFHAFPMSLSACFWHAPS